MTSKERLMAVLRKQVPDRVPISTYELIGWNLQSWENQQPSYQSLMDYIRDKTDCMYMTRVPMVNRYVIEHMHTKKWKDGNSTYTRVTILTPKGELTSLHRVDEGINTIWRLERPVKNEDDVEKYLSIPSDPQPVDTSALRQEAEALGEKGILLIDIADPLCVAAELFEFGQYTIMAYTNPRLFIKLLDKLFDEQMFFLEDMLQKGAGPLFRIVGPEYATSPYLAPEHFHRFVCAYDKRMIRLIHDYGQYARVHCHGRIRQILPHIIEIEADAMDPLEAPPSGDIELSEIKRLYGDRLCLMGNIQLRDLEYAPANDMKAIVKKCIEDGKEGGGFVIMPTAAPINTPLSSVTERNYRIMIDSALQYGRY